VSDAAIHGLDGNPWATSAGFSITPAEATALVTGFDNQAPFHAGGIRVSGLKYMFLRATEETIHGKKGGDSGIVICKTGKAIIIGTYRDGLVAGACSATVSKLMDYLRNAGY